MNEIMSLLQAGRHAELTARVRDALQSEPDSGVLWKALSLALSLQGADALDASARAAALLPGDAEAHANLGNALLRAARYDDAIVSYRRALDIEPRSPEVFNNLGNALRSLGRPDEAVACYRQAIDQNPGFAEAHSNLGNALRSVGRLDSAVTHYHRALEIRPESPQAWNNLGNVLLDLRKFDDAATCYRSALSLKTDFAEAHSNLGNALRGLGHLEEAVASYARALELKPDFAAAHGNVADALRDLGLPTESAAHARIATELAPTSAAAHNALANASFDLGKPEEAEALYRRAVALDPKFAAGLINLGLLLRQRGMAAAALECAQRALAAQPDAAPAAVLMAQLNADAGEFAAAERLFRHALELDAGLPEALAGLAYLKRMSEADEGWAEQALKVAERRLPPRSEVYLRFAIGKYFDDVKNYARAFENFSRAHEVASSYSPKYDPQQQTQRVDRLIERFRAQPAAAPRKADRESARAVFIVGLPRSGTSLAEQILASHPSVFGAGEVSFWEGAMRKIQAGTGESGLHRQAARFFGGEYLMLLESLSADATRVIDKMPANGWCLGLIHEALPQARIIHMQRDALDTCLSIYFQHFNNALPQANDLQDLAHYHREYSRIMAHWRSVLPPGVMLEVPYESLVEDQEVWSRRMVEFIGLRWDPRCLDFHRTSRSVKTASQWQVRQKLDRSSIERWRNYEAFIEPLLRLLARR